MVAKLSAACSSCGAATRKSLVVLWVTGYPMVAF
jgi:hypothetical protein